MNRKRKRHKHWKQLQEDIKKGSNKENGKNSYLNQLFYNSWKYRCKTILDVLVVFLKVQLTGELKHSNILELEKTNQIGKKPVRFRRKDVILPDHGSHSLGCFILTILVVTPKRNISGQEMIYFDSSSKPLECFWGEGSMGDNDWMNMHVPSSRLWTQGSYIQLYTSYFLDAMKQTIGQMIIIELFQTFIAKVNWQETCPNLKWKLNCSKCTIV